MGNLTRYRSSDLPELMDKIMKNSIGINDDYLDRFFNITTQTNYPPYNLVQVSNELSRLEIALAGFKKNPSMSIKDWLRDLSKEPGHSQMILKSEMFHLKMDSLPLNWVR